MSVIFNTISLVCHSIILSIVLYQYSALGTIISLLFFLTGSVLPNLVAYLSGIELSLSFFSLFADIWKWKSIYVVRICVLLIASFLLGYSILETVHESNLHYESLTRAMDQYPHDVNAKASLDHLQMKLKCCGSRNYTDWYHIPWYVGKVKLPAPGLLTQEEVKVKDDVPFSCCSDALGVPCIHFGVESPHPVFKYSPGVDLTIWKDGCGRLLIETAQWLHSVLTHFLVLIVLAQIIQCIATGSQYANDKRLTQMKDIANTNVNDEDVQNVPGSNNNETTNIQNKVNINQTTEIPVIVNEPGPFEVTQTGKGKIRLIDVGENVEKKKVTFDEQENVVIRDRKLNNLWRKSSQKTKSKEVPENKDIHKRTPENKDNHKSSPENKNNHESTLDRKFRNPTYSSATVDEIKDQSASPSGPDDSDVNITETLKDLRDKVFKKIDNQRKYLLGEKTRNSSGKNVSQTPTRYQRTLRYLPSKLRRSRVAAPSRRKRGGVKTWSELIATQLDGLKNRYGATKRRRRDEGGPRRERPNNSVVVMRVQAGRRGGTRYPRQTDRYYSSSSPDTTASPPRYAAAAERHNDGFRVRSFSGKTDTSRTMRPGAHQYFDHSPPHSKSKSQEERESSRNSPFVASGVSASTTGDEMFRKHKREITSSENRSNVKVTAQRTQASKGPRVEFPYLSPSTSSTYF